MTPLKGELQFPCHWEYRIVLESAVAESVRTSAAAIFLRHGLQATLTPGPESGRGTYRILLAALEVPDRAVMETVGQELAHLPGVKLLL